MSTSNPGLVRNWFSQPRHLARLSIFWMVILLLTFGLTLYPTKVAHAATYTVTNTNDSGNGSLRQAMLSAESDPAADVINFSLPSLPATITLASALPIIRTDITINGPTSGELTINGNTQFTVFFVGYCCSTYYKGGTLTLTNLTIASGATTGAGGGIYVIAGKLNVTDSKFIGNQALSSNGGAIYARGSGDGGSTINITRTTFLNNQAAYGGGLSTNDTTLTIRDSYFSSNQASSGAGGLDISSGSVATITGTTIANNISLNDTGGLGAYYASPINITNSTIFGNRANRYGGGIAFTSSNINLFNSTVASNNSAYQIGGIYQYSGTITLKNTIVADNTANDRYPDYYGQLTSQGYNLIGNTTGATISGITTGNKLNFDAMLAPLADNGGPTLTVGLLVGSPAIDAGTNLNAPTTDQRGQPRITGGTIDMGAVELTVPYAGTYFHALANPSRIYDSRPHSDTTIPGGQGALGAGATRSLQVGGIKGIPANAKGVVGNLTAAGTQAGGYLSLYPGTSWPGNSSVNWNSSGQAIANFAITQLADGKMTARNSGDAGSQPVDFIFDAIGYLDNNPSEATYLHTLNPSRVYDSRTAEGAIPAGGGRNITINSSAVPTGAKAAIVNLTATQTGGAGGYVSVYAKGTSLPPESNRVSAINWNRAGESVANFAIVPLSSDKGIVAYSVNTSTQLIVDVVGYLDGDSTSGLNMSLVTPGRAYDSRTAGGALAPETTRNNTITGLLGVPTNAKAAIVNLTVANTGNNGYVSLYPGNASVPPVSSRVSSINWSAPNQAVANLAIIPVDPATGQIKVLAGETSTQYLIDIIGFVN